MNLTYRSWRATANPNRKAGGLAPREAQHLMALACGMTQKEIAREFGVSPSTVGHSLTRIYQRLGVERGTAAVAIAIRRGWIAPMALVLLISAMTPDAHWQRVRQPRTRTVTMTKLARRELACVTGGAA
ncbi:response regulator transcription factor [Modicisalibacter coralii]|uniref:response regulator transcription factor n=1 Tax=Modicisalibacter coralii TaxID=2304602 RepID=UPI00100BE9B9|nr:LuxR C-terminal-related transcriptional regulator [Halomonas coralii]